MRIVVYKCCIRLSRSLDTGVPFVDIYPSSRSPPVQVLKNPCKAAMRRSRGSMPNKSYHNTPFSPNTVNAFCCSDTILSAALYFAAEASGPPSQSQPKRCRTYSPVFNHLTQEYGNSTVLDNRLSMIRSSCCALQMLAYQLLQQSTMALLLIRGCVRG